MSQKKHYRIVRNRRGKVVLPAFMASANAFMGNIGFVDLINDAVKPKKFNFLIFQEIYTG